VPLQTVHPVIKENEATTNAIHLPSPSGRTLVVSATWKNPTGIWKVGIKFAYDLWPSDLVTRRKAVRAPSHDIEDRV